jgi:hypothetical protein
LAVHQEEMWKGKHWKIKMQIQRKKNWDTVMVSPIFKPIIYLNMHVEFISTQSGKLTFKNRASYIKDGRTATLQMLHFIYFFSKYKYWVF